MNKRRALLRRYRESSKPCTTSPTQVQPPNTAALGSLGSRSWVFGSSGFATINMFATRYSLSNINSQSYILNSELTVPLTESGSHTDGVEFFEFIVDPTSFATTVENMFHLSFLVKVSLTPQKVKSFNSLI